MAESDADAMSDAEHEREEDELFCGVLQNQGVDLDRLGSTGSGFGPDELVGGAPDTDVDQGQQVFDATRKSLDTATGVLKAPGQVLSAVTNLQKGAQGAEAALAAGANSRYLAPLASAASRVAAPAFQGISTGVRAAAPILKGLTTAAELAAPALRVLGPVGLAATAGLYGYNALRSIKSNQDLADYHASLYGTKRTPDAVKERLMYDARNAASNMDPTRRSQIKRWMETHGYPTSPVVQKHAAPTTFGAKDVLNTLLTGDFGAKAREQLAAEQEANAGVPALLLKNQHNQQLLKRGHWTKQRGGALSARDPAFALASLFPGIDDIEPRAQTDKLAARFDTGGKMIPEKRLPAPKQVTPYAAMSNGQLRHHLQTARDIFERTLREFTEAPEGEAKEALRREGILVEGERNGILYEISRRRMYLHNRSAAASHEMSDPTHPVSDERFAELMSQVADDNNHNHAYFGQLMDEGGPPFNEAYGRPDKYDGRYFWGHPHPPAYAGTNYTEGEGFLNGAGLANEAGAVSAVGVGKALSGEEVEKLTRCPGIKTHRYPDLEQVPDWAALMGTAGAALVLFLTDSPTNGHWICAFDGPDGAHFFDPIGIAVDAERFHISAEMREELDEKKPQMRRLLKSSGKPIFVSKHEFQEDAPGVNTCGRWVALRIQHRHETDKEFAAWVRRQVKESGKTSDEWIADATRAEVGGSLCGSGSGTATSGGALVGDEDTSMPALTPQGYIARAGQAARQNTQAEFMHALYYDRGHEALF